MPIERNVGADEGFEGDVVGQRAVENCALQLWGQRCERDHTVRVAVGTSVCVRDLFDRSSGLERFGPFVSVAQCFNQCLVWLGLGLARYDLGFLTAAAAGESGPDGEQSWIEVGLFEIEAGGYGRRLQTDIDGVLGDGTKCNGRLPGCRIA